MTYVEKADLKRTLRVKALYKRLFGEPFPANWIVEWHVRGLTVVPHMRAVYLMCDDMKDPDDFHTVVHELLHVNRPMMEHGKEFEKEVRRLLRRAKDGNVR